MQEGHPPKGMACSKCGSADIRSSSEGFLGALAPLFGRWPFRCRVRFYLSSKTEDCANNCMVLRTTFDTILPATGRGTGLRSRYVQHAAMPQKKISLRA